MFSLLTSLAQAVSYLGSPPPGLAFVKFQSQVEPIQVEILGTLKPLTLSLNGRSVPLRESEHMAQAGERKVSINGEALELQGTGGRFYHLAEVKSQNESRIQILLQTGNGRSYVYELDLKLAFFEFPLQGRRELPIADSSVLEISGPWNPDWEIVLNRGKAERQNDQMRILIPIRPGLNHFNGKIRFPDGNVRTFNIPITVETEIHSPEHPYLVLQSPGAEPDLTMDSHGVDISGVTNPQAKIRFGEQSVISNEQGVFQFRWRPRLPLEEVSLQVEWQNHSISQSYKVSCSDCVVSPKIQNEFPYEVMFIFGLGDVYGQTGERHGFAFIYHSNWVFGYNEVGLWQAHERFHYKSFNPNLGYQFDFANAWAFQRLELGIQLRSSERGFYDYQGMSDQTVTRNDIAPYVRLEVFRLRFLSARFFSLGGQLDSGRNDESRFMLDTRLIYSW